jgi:hypothetical protein
MHVHLPALLVQAIDLSPPEVIATSEVISDLSSVVCVVQVP